MFQITWTLGLPENGNLNSMKVMELSLKIFSLLRRMGPLLEQINSLLRLFLLISKYSSLDGYRYNKKVLKFRELLGEKGGIVLSKER